MTPLKIEVTEAMADAAAEQICEIHDDFFVWEKGHGHTVDDRAKAYYTKLATAALTAAFQHPEFVRQIVPEWLPIESAPKDGGEVLLADSDSVTSGFYHDGSECYGHRGNAGFFCEEDRGNLLTASNFHATHWQPMPEPPRASLGRLLGEEGK